MKKRIFIAINLPEDVRTVLVEYQNKYKDVIPASWTKPENLHITLLFIGDAEEEGIPEIKKTIQDVVVQQKSFSLTLNRNCYGPPQIIPPQTVVVQRIEPPRMIWAIGEKSEKFNLLCDKLEEALASSPKIRFKPENRENILHITLARIKEWEWRRIEPDERPEIEEDINLSFEVKSVELMESKLKRTGPEYITLESYKLNNN